MAYLSRIIETKIKKMNSLFKIILLTGARQVGKSTLLKQLAQAENRQYITLDDPLIRDLAKNDPAMFLQRYQAPLIIDEIQYAPELFPYLKIIADDSEKPGLFWLAGTQQCSTMKKIQESLAGRVGIFQLYGLKFSELKQTEFSAPLDFSLENLQKRANQTSKNNLLETFDFIWQGSLPQIALQAAEFRDVYYHSYLNFYLMRDAQELGETSDSTRFNKFLIACASAISEPVNYANLAHFAGISEPTAKTWLQLLVGLGIIYLLPPYFNSELKRVSKAPKLYFCDLGLASYLAKWTTRDALLDSHFAEAFFKNYIVMELVKECFYSTSRINLSYYRDSNDKEIDLIVENSRKLNPLDISFSASPEKNTVKNFNFLQKIPQVELGDGGIICMVTEVIPIDEHNCFIPSNLL